ncbi:hypothetical protein ACMFMF_005106 [Clarireedia jacksonii]
MVNTGTPSKGCYLCRARRIKCDEGKPHCARCQKSKRQCPGYRDASELKPRKYSKADRRMASMYLNPNDPAFKVNSYSYGRPSMDRAWAKRADIILEDDLCHSQEHLISTNTPGYSSYQHLGNATLGFPTSVVGFDARMSITIPKQFSPPLDQRAMCFFLSNFVLLPHSSAAKGHLEFLVPLVQQSSKNSTLVLTLNAVALAALANQPNTRELQSAADSQYCAALNQINKDLQDAKKAQQDSTLASVFLLSIYETVECIGHSKEVKEDADWWNTFAIGDPVQHRLSILNMKVAGLRAESHRVCTLKADTTENVERVLQHLRKAQALDQDYINWVEDLPEPWKPSPEFWINTSLDADMEFTNFYPGRVDTYRDIWMATTQNLARVSRLFILTTILRCTAWLTLPLNYEETNEYVTASEQARVLIEEIIASIPYYFGHEAQDTSNSAFNDSYFPCGSNSKVGGTGVTGVFAMWPIFAALGSDFTSDSQRLWLRGRLKYIAETLGIHQARMLLKLQTRYPSTFIYLDRSAKLNMVVPRGTPVGTHPTARVR